MTTSDEPMLLTDDEVLAMADFAGHEWMRPLPTVDQSAASAVTAAVARGYRTLLLRGYVGDKGDVSPTLLRFSEVSGRQPVLVAAGIDADGAVDAHNRFEVFVREDQVVVMMVADLGIATFVASNPDDVRAALADFIAERASESGILFLRRDRRGLPVDSYLKRASACSILEASSSGGWSEPKPISNERDLITRVLDW